MRFIKEPEKRIEIIDEVEVLVVGGGPAGIGAAIASARSDKKCLLIERYGYLGGMATGGLVLLVGPFSDNKKEVLGGIARELITRSIELGWAIWNKNHQGYATVDPEGLKYMANQMVKEAGAELLMHSFVTQAITEDNTIKGLIFESKKGRQAILADIVIDATGDGDICASAGCEFEQEHHPWGISLVCRIGGVNIKKTREFQEIHPEEWNQLKEIMEKKGFTSSWMETIDEGVVWCDSSFYPNRDPLDPKELTFVEVQSRELIFNSIEFYRENLPGFEDCYLIDTASQIGVRETRRIIGEYILKSEDVKTSQDFHDKVFVGSTEISPRIRYYLPYRSLIPKNMKGLLVAGRFISCTHDCLDLIRTISPCIAMGQAAGTAAALSIEKGVIPKELNPKKIQEALIKDGVLLK